MPDPFGLPPLPPAEKNLSEVITRFNGWIDSDNTSVKGLYTIKLALPGAERYKAVRLMEHRGLLVHFEVWARNKDELGIVDMVEEMERQERNS